MSKFMYELEGAQFEKGKFEIRSGKKAWGPLRILLLLGPIRGRFVVLGILMVAAFATIQRQPGTLFVTNAWVSSPEQAALVQNIFSWGLCSVAVLVWLVFLLFRDGVLTLEFNKTRGELRTVEEPLIRQKLERKGIFPFSDIQEIRVVSRNKEAQSSHGFLSLKVKDAEGQIQSFTFRFLSDEQFKFFPLNIYRITGVEPVGDWTDPDSEQSEQKK